MLKSPLRLLNRFNQSYPVAYETAQRVFLPIAVFSLLASSLIARLVGFDAVPGLIAVALMTAPLVIAMHKKICGEGNDSKTFDNFNDAWPDMESAIVKYVDNERSPRVRLLGVTMRTYAVNFELLLTALLSRKGSRDLKIEIAMLDPNWERLDEFLGVARTGQVRTSHEAIKDFEVRNQAKMEELNWEISVRLYRHTPCIYGLLLGDETLYQGKMVWDAQSLRGGTAVVQRFDVTDIGYAPRYISEFAGWFDASSRPIDGVKIKSD